MAKATPFWQPKKPLLSIFRVTMLVALSPVLLVAIVMTPAFWLLRKVFPPAPLSAADMVSSLTMLIEGEGDPYVVSDALDELDERCSTAELEALKQRVVRLGDPPWNEAAIDELRAIRESARALTAGDAT